MKGKKVETIINEIEDIRIYNLSEHKDKYLDGMLYEVEQKLFKLLDSL